MRLTPHPGKAQRTPGVAPRHFHHFGYATGQGAKWPQIRGWMYTYREVREGRREIGYPGQHQTMG